MSKNHRGTGIRTLPAHGRGICAVCGKDSIKVLFEQDVNGSKVKICKFCNAALKNKARKEVKAAPAVEASAQ